MKQTVLVATLGLLCYPAASFASYLVRSYALRHSVLDLPNERSSHSQPTPRGGGLAIVFVTASAVALAAGLSLVTPYDAFVLLAGMCVVAAVGWIDDTGHIEARTRLAVHSVTAILTIYLLGGFPSIRLGGAVLHLGITGYFIGTMGIVWSINLFNFMDGIDGLAGSQATVILGALGVLFLAGGDMSLGTIALVCSISVAGFLRWNWPPATLFLGDVGSGALGYLIASLAVASENRASIPLLTFAIVGGVFIGDATVTLLRRLARGHSPTHAHREHAYQRLADAWGGHLPVSVAAAVATVALALIGTVGAMRPDWLSSLFILAVVFVSLLLAASERIAPM